MPEPLPETRALTDWKPRNRIQNERKTEKTEEKNTKNFRLVALDKNTQTDPYWNCLYLEILANGLILIKQNNSFIFPWFKRDYRPVLSLYYHIMRGSGSFRHSFQNFTPLPLWLSGVAVAWYSAAVAGCLVGWCLVCWCL